MINHEHYGDEGNVVVSIVHEHDCTEVQVVTEGDTIEIPSTIYYLKHNDIEDLDDFIFDLIRLGRAIKAKEIREVLNVNDVPSIRSFRKNNSAAV